MYVDPQELHAVQTAGGSAPRVDLYAGIHKALRAMMADALVAVGSLDSDDTQETSLVCAKVLALTDECLGHLARENEFVHPAIDAALAGATHRIAHDHEVELGRIEGLRQSVQKLRTRSGTARAAAALALYRQLAVFVADNFEHMQVEETSHNQVLWDHYSDAQLMELHDLIVASLTPAEVMSTMRWMVPAMTPTERLQMLTGMQSGVAHTAFAAVLDVVRPHLNSSNWAKLARGLGVAPHPGLMAA